MFFHEIDMEMRQWLNVEKKKKKKREKIRSVGGGGDQRSQRSEKAEDVERSGELSEKSLLRYGIV